MKQKLRLFAIHQTTTNLQRLDNLNSRTKWYPALDESKLDEIHMFQNSFG